MNVKYWVAFSSVEQIDSTFVQRLYNYFGDIERAFNASKQDLEHIDGLSVKNAEKFLKLRDSVNIDKTFEEVEKRGINVAFVGSRRASSDGRGSVKRIISELRNTDICIVSGLAEGIDSVSHRSAIENNLKTIGVIASGFDFKYPSSNRDLYEKLSSGYGAVVTEYYPTFEPIKFRFPQRNRIVTGLSYGTVVGEAAIKSGALISANLTLEQGRELMCVPGSINSKNTEGIYKLLKNGATMVTSGEDILNALNWEIKTDAVSKTEVSSLYNEILDFIDVEPVSFDFLQSKTGLLTEELLNRLTMMEIEGLIEQTDGDRYKRI